MYRPKILLADNDTDFVDAAMAFFEAADYDLIVARNPSEARHTLEDGWANLAILDLRLIDDEDDKDRSGLDLANGNPGSIPVIMLTKFQTWEAVRESLGIGDHERSPAIDFVAKQEGMEELIRRVEQALYQRPSIAINWKLRIEWEGLDPFSLVRQFEADLNGTRLLDRAHELEDLLRQLFIKEDGIRLVRSLWQRESRAAAVVFSHSAGMKPDSFLVVLGPRASVLEEAKRLETFGPTAPGDSATILTGSAFTTHLAANRYAFASNDLEQIQTLREICIFLPPPTYKRVLNNLFQETLRSWHQDKPILQEKSTENCYRQRLQLQAEPPVLAAVAQTVRLIEMQFSDGPVKMERRGGKAIVYSAGQSTEYPDPLKLLGQPIQPAETLRSIYVPGTLMGENILADESGQTWLTDFAEAGQAPIFWNYVTLEATVRFDWTESANLTRRKDLEHSLIDSSFAKPDIRDLQEPAIRRPAQIIEVIRKLAARTVGPDILEYHLGIFLEAARRLAQSRVSFPPTGPERTRLAHAWLAMTLIGEKLAEEKPKGTNLTSHAMDELRVLDMKTRTILVDGYQIRLSPKRFAVFNFLYAKANQVCTKEELLEEALEGKYGENYLQKLIAHIREKLGESGEQQRYLITELNTGYRLVTKPK